MAKSELSMLSAALLVGCASAAQMNAGGVPYKISNPSGQGEYSTEFTDEYFDVYGEVTTRYSQVYWTRNAPVPLPQNIIDRFKGKVMAITGYEIDQVMKTADGDKSIPIYNAYNHHYFAWLMGDDAEMYEADTPTNAPNPTYTRVRDKANDHGYPTNIVFKENPGGEFRKSFHGYPKGYAQLLHSPNNWVVEPMQIDTHNRKYNATEVTGLKPSFLPKQDDGTNDPNSQLSPLIECPCSTRITKKIVNDSEILTQGSCPVKISSAQACGQAVSNFATLVGQPTTVQNTSLPQGCIMKPVAGGYAAIFNQAPASTAMCDIDYSHGKFTGQWKTMQATALNCVDNHCLAPSAEHKCTGEFKGQCTWDSVADAQKYCGEWDACQGFVCSTAYDSEKKLLCFARGTAVPKAGLDHETTSYTKINTPSEADFMQGEMNDALVNVSVTHNGVNATITMTGPNGVWFGAGFNAGVMADLPYTIIVDGKGAVTERKLVEHGPGTLLKPSVQVVSSTVSGSSRTVVLSRPIAGASADYYTIPSTPGAIKMIVAVGGSVELAYHKARTGSQLVLLPSEASSCLCQPTSTSYITYMNKSTSEFHIDCLPEPRGDMAAQHNPACQMMSYQGGLRCCKHTWFLTDAEQDSLIPPQVDTYYIKFRYYFQEYTPATPTAPASHIHMHHWVFLIDANVNDYTEVACENHDPNCIGTIHAHVTVNTMGLEDVPSKFSSVSPHVMTPHCHAPSCIRQELWNADTGELICNVTALYGNGIEVFNEANYIALPPCLWGHEDGLKEPLKLTPNTNLTAIKYFNNSWRHLGQMAQWTGLLVFNP